VSRESLTERRPSLADLCDTAARQFAAGGVGGAAPRRDAIRLITEVLGLGIGDVQLHRDRAMDSGELDRVSAAVARRAAGEPLGYVTGVVGFRHLLIACDRRVLIPRPETEGLVDRALALTGSAGGVALDVGTGSGCIALSLRHEGKYRRVVGVDYSDDALAVAAANRARLGLDVELVRGDLTTPFAPESVDVVVANPPYVSAGEYRVLDRSVRDYEPRVALESGFDGLEATRRLLADAARVLRPGGVLLVEIASDRATQTAELARSVGWDGARIEDDWFGRGRYLIARWEGES